MTDRTVASLRLAAGRPHPSQPSARQLATNRLTLGWDTPWARVTSLCDRRSGGPGQGSKRPPRWVARNFSAAA
jgi:hypothetical protein